MESVESKQTFPVLDQLVLDTTDARGLAEFYRTLLGYVYRNGDEPPGEGQADERGQDWLVIHHPSGFPRVAFQQVRSLKRSTWPEDDVPQQLHLDMTVPSREELEIPAAARWTEIPSDRISAPPDADGIIAVGGGSAIDTAKAASAASSLPLVSVPTTYSGAELTASLATFCADCDDDFVHVLAHDTPALDRPT